MKIRTSLSLVTLLFAAGVACKKDSSSNNNNSGSVNKVKVYIQSAEQPGAGSQSDTFNVYYDNQNRLSSLVLKSDTASKFVYKYESDRFYLDIMNGATIIIHNTFYLNSSRTLVDSAIQINNTFDTTLTKYVYNSNNQLIEEREYTPNGTSRPDLDNTTKYTYDANGLLIKEVDNNDETDYKYDQVIKNTVDVGTPYMAVPKQLPTQAIVYNSGSVLETTNYVYTFDSQNRIIKDKETTTPGGLVVTNSYQYY